MARLITRKIYKVIKPLYNKFEQLRSNRGDYKYIHEEIFKFGKYYCRFYADTVLKDTGYISFSIFSEYSELLSINLNNGKRSKILGIEECEIKIEFSNLDYDSVKNGLVELDEVLNELLNYFENDKPKSK